MIAVAICEKLLLPRQCLYYKIVLIDLIIRWHEDSKIYIGSILDYNHINILILQLLTMMHKSTKNILIYICFFVFRLPFSLYEEKLAYAYRKFIIRDLGNPINLIKPYTDLRMLWLFNHIKLHAVIKLSILTYLFLEIKEFYEYR